MRSFIWYIRSWSPSHYNHCKRSNHPIPETVPKWNIKKAKWEDFQNQCITKFIPDLFNDAGDEMVIKNVINKNKKYSIKMNSN